MTYARLSEYYRRHHKRYVRYIESMPRKLACQECGGMGSFHEAILDYGEGPDYDCGFCEGTGYITPHMRAWWLRWKKSEKRAKLFLSAR